MTNVQTLERPETVVTQEPPVAGSPEQTVSHQGEIDTRQAFELVKQAAQQRAQGNPEAAAAFSQAARDQADKQLAN